jgi:hypothetical protein
MIWHFSLLSFFFFSLRLRNAFFGFHNAQRAIRRAHTSLGPGNNGKREKKIPFLCVK